MLIRRKNAKRRDDLVFITCDSVCLEGDEKEGKKRGGKKGKRKERGKDRITEKSPSLYHPGHKFGGIGEREKRKKTKEKEERLNAWMQVNPYCPSL